jgi:hypothetical protein
MQDEAYHQGYESTEKCEPEDLHDLTFVIGEAYPMAQSRWESNFGRSPRPGSASVVVSSATPTAAPAADQPANLSAPLAPPSLVLPSP